MGKTYRRASDESDGRQKKPKHHGHSNGKKSGGMKIINDLYQDDDFFYDEIQIHDDIVINKTRDETS